MEDYSISIYLDRRRAKENGMYPVKLRAYCAHLKKQKFYRTKFEFTEKEFKSIWETSRPRKEHKSTRKKLQELLSHAENCAEELDRFTFSGFEKRLHRKSGDGVKLNYHYEETIQTLTRRGRVGTASNYRCSRNSLKTFVEWQKGDFSELTFMDVTPEWLEHYEQYLIDTGKTINTVGIYLRPLRAVFNKAVEDGDIKEKFYPFGKRKYQIPAVSVKKKSLNMDDLPKLRDAAPTTEHQQKAKDFWFFSYSSNGMNMKDVAQLRWSDVDGNSFVFFRGKTRRTSKSNLKEIKVLLNDFSKQVIEKYGVHENKPTGYVFDILEEGISPDERKRRIDKFNRFIGKHLKVLAASVEVDTKISPKWARYYFTTHLTRNGAPLEFSQEALGHSSKGTTEAYFDGFDDATKTKYLKGIMDF